MTVARQSSSQGTVTKVAQGGRQIPHPVIKIRSVHITIMTMDPWATNQQIEELLPPEEYTIISGLTDEELAQRLGVEVEELLSML